MKKFMLILALLLGGAAHAGEVFGQTIGPLSSSGCVRANLLGANISTLTANVTWGAGVGTLTFSVSTDKAASYTTIPTTRTSTPTMTAGGLAEFKVAGYTDFKACYVGSLTPVTLTFYGNGGVLAFSPDNPGAIGGSAPAAGTFTALTATTSEDFTAHPLGVTSGGTGTATGGITTAALAAPASVTAIIGGAPGCGTLSTATTYYYKVTAVNSAGETLGSSEASYLTVNAQACVKVSWAAVAGATSYNVYGRTTGAETKITASIGTTALTYTDTGTSLSGALPTRNSTADEVHVGIAGTGTSTTAALPTTCTNGQQVYDTTASVVKVCASNTWTAIGAGTVTSVAQTAPGEFTVGGSPVTGAGTLALSYTATQTAGGVVYADGTKRVVTAAGTSGQALLSNAASAPSWGSIGVAGGGTGEGNTGWSSTARPLSPDSRNDEFDSFSGWTTTLGSCAQSGTAIDPYAQFNTANVYRHSENSYWPGWIVWQGTSANVVCGAVKAFTINTNDLVWAHFRVTGFSTSNTVASASSANLCIADSVSITHYVCAQVFYDGANFAFQSNTDGVTAKTTLTLPQGGGSGYEGVLAIQKIGTSYITYLDRKPYAAVTNVNAMAAVALEEFGSYTTTTPGNTLTAFDYVRFQNSATALPW